MKNQNLNNYDANSSGIYRCKLLDDNGTIRCYIPGISSEKPYDENGNLIVTDLANYPEIQWCCYNLNSIDMLNVDEPVYIMFENGDVKKPVVISYWVIGGSSGGGYGGYTGGPSSRQIYVLPTDEELEKYDKDKFQKINATFTITHYCACSACCGKSESDPGYGVTASGAKVKEGRTIAVDPNVIPLGSVIEINGHRYVAEDTGGAIKGFRIDIYMANHSAALNAGKYTTTEVSIYKP